MSHKPGETTKLRYLPFISFAVAVVIAAVAGPSLRALARQSGDPTNTGSSGEIKVTHIVFNHKWSNEKEGAATADALSIRTQWDASLGHGPFDASDGRFVGEAGAGEWIVDPDAPFSKSERNEPALYLRETRQTASSTTIMVRFEAKNVADADLYYVPQGEWPAVTPVKVSFTDKKPGDELNKFQALTLRSVGGNPESYTTGSKKTSSDYITFRYTGKFPDVVSRRTPLFNWWAENVRLKDGTVIAKMQLNPSGLPNPTDPANVTGHELFNVLETPKLPWYEAGEDRTFPWALALRDVTNPKAALGEATLPDASRKICIYLFGFKGFTYDRKEGKPHFYPDPGDTFQLQDYIRVITKKVNCLDQACGNVSYMNLVGADATVQWKHPYGFVKPGDLVGVGRCNNPFGSPLVVPDLDITRTKFKSHGYALFGGKVYDACVGPEVGTRDEVAHWEYQVDQTACVLYERTYPNNPPVYNFKKASVKVAFKLGE